ncbi:hypothetical protein [Nostoc sp. FACHB-190]|uniref:hypothetical protein n=1 Tax=Nostoc sp. FACHB-190 TaxID=2692838 RepID=UPI001681E6C2|nr:hypothetical protein [Nostoc sp. FACHB-190]MBD2302245.1 hypothetical protein [Nostoc sp. FACHB-190]
MPKQVDFRFQISEHSPYATLIKYLSPKNKLLEFPRHNMITWALAAFWHPLACKWSGRFSDADLKLKARTAIYQLQQQIIYLAHVFGLESELGNQEILTNPFHYDADLEPNFDGSTPKSLPTLNQSDGEQDLRSLMSCENDELLDEAFK